MYLFSVSSLATILDKVFSNFTAYYQSFYSLQVRQYLITCTKNTVYKLPHELPNDLRIRILGNQEMLGEG